MLEGGLSARQEGEALYVASWVASESGAGAIDVGETEQAAIAAQQFGWGDHLPDLVAFGTSLVAELGRGES